MQNSLLCESASNKCLYNSSGCFFLVDECVPKTSNKCCTKDPENLKVNFLGAQVNYGEERRGAKRRSAANTPANRYHIISLRLFRSLPSR